MPERRSRSGPRPAGRIRQAGRLLRAEGPAGVAARLLRRGADALTPAGYGSLPVAREDLVRAAELTPGGGGLPGPAPWGAGEPLRVAWVCGPAGEGSGGHTTMFRIIAALERAGHRCSVHIHDRHGWEIEEHRRRIRAWWPWMEAEVRDLAAGIDDAHAIVATSWETAYPVLASPALGARCYFVQDYEPAFHPAGSIALLAEATYGFGFHGVTAGPWLARMLREKHGMPADHFDFGCDAERYRLDRSPGAADERRDVCYFCRPSTPRRAHDLAVAALDLFAARRPDVTIHAFGEPAGRLPFPVVDHGLLTPDELNALYNRCVAGLVLSATNVSLVPHEMLAAGCIPVVNDAEHNRLVLGSDEVGYAPATPFGLAAELSRLLARPPRRRAEAAQAAAGLELHTWAEAGRRVEEILRGVVESGQPARGRLAEAVAP